MTATQGSARALRRISVSMSSVLLAAAAVVASAQEVTVALSGSNEIPPVSTAASGTGRIGVSADRSITVRVTVTGMTPTVAHIHEAPAGVIGPVIVPLVKDADGTWSVAPGTQLTDAQLAAFKAGNLYFNVHSEAYRSGEIRGQIKP